MAKLTRFSMLEVRREGEEEDKPAPSSATAQRFASVDTQAAEPAAARFVPGAERFQKPEERVELEEKSAELPFLRCANCRTDSSRFVTACDRCGAPFDTPEQRAFNEAVRLDLEAQVAKDKELTDTIEANRLIQSAEEDARRRKTYEDLARDAGQRARQSIGDGGGAALWEALRALWRRRWW